MTGNAASDVDLAAYEGVVGAIRLARVGAANDGSFVRIVDQLLLYAPATPDRATEPTAMLVRAMDELKATISVGP